MQEELTIRDRALRGLFVGLAVGLAWGIRGDFGHSLGAAYPGAVLGLAFAYVSGQPALYRWMPFLGALGAWGISFGGRMSYGILHGYAQSDTFINYAYGYFTLFLQGGAWGAYGCVLLALALERERLSLLKFAALVAAVFLSGFLFFHLVVSLIGFHINPHRSDLSIAYTGGIIGLFAGLIYFKQWYAVKGAMLGYIGFGLGMSVGRFMGNLAAVQPIPINHWNVMEVMVGVIGGFIFTFGMLGKVVEPPPNTLSWKILGALSCVGVMALPLLHLRGRVEMPKSLEEWTNSLTGYGYANAAEIAGRVHTLLLVVCVGALCLGVVWLFLWGKNSGKVAWLPVMGLSLAMVLFQNTRALYFWYPRQPGSINMHTNFWLLFILMAMFVLFVRLRPAVQSDEAAETSHWKRWVLGSVAAYLLVIFFAGFVNGDTTMRSANTRWPVWAWTQGPFPGR